jgi:outer membrane receptor for ferrienterochelin and colicin
MSKPRAPFNVCAALAAATSALCPPAIAGEADRVLTPVAVTEEVAVEELSPHRTGGDVHVVTRQEIDDLHFPNVTEAIRRIPGVQVSGPGYKAYEYGTTFGEEVSINGDSSVIIMVDGRRVDNDASSYGAGNASKSRVPLDVLTNINNIERIEVIKGTGSAAYGADATGGVINIITRRGGDEHQTRLEASAGSWGKRNYSLTQSGSFGADDSFRYFASASYQESDDTKYKDWVTGRTITYRNTRYHDAGGSLQLSKSFNENHEVSLQWSGTAGKSHYPITSLDMATIDLLYDSQLPLGTVNGVPANQRPGYRNWFYWDATLGSYTRPRSNDVDLKYAFSKRDGVESYLRAYRNERNYRTRLFGGVFGTQWEDVTPEIIAQAQRSAGSWRTEIVDAVELQLARTIGRHALLTGWTYSESGFESNSLATGLSSFVDRDSLKGYVQDRFRITDRWVVTPGINYSSYSEIKRRATNGAVTNRGDSSKVTYSFRTSYDSGILGNLHASWAQIFRPKTNNDYNNEAPAIEPLFDEEGNSWTAGLRKTFGEDTAAEINFAYTDMSNVIKRYSVFDPNVVNAGAPSGFGNFVTRQVNATQETKAVNVGLDHRFNDNWRARLSYAYVNEEFEAKNWRTNPDDINVNALINRFRPRNTYQANATYTAGRWTINGWSDFYTGMSERYFTDEHFLVFGLSANYDLPGLLGGEARTFLTVDNLTNQHWENRAHPVYGPGTYPQPGRSFMIGFQQNF